MKRAFLDTLDRHGPAALLIAGLLTLATLFVALRANNFIYLDQWRMVVPLLGPYFAGEFAWSDLLYVESAHIRWGYNVVFLGNAAFFGLDSKLEIFCGLLFLTTLSTLIYLRFRESIVRPVPGWLIALALVAVLLPAWSLNKSSHFGWSLLSFNAFFSWLLYFVFWVLIDSEILRRPHRVRWVLLVLVSLVSMYGFSGAAFLSAFSAGIAIALVAAIVRPDIRIRAISLAVFLAVACAIETAVYTRLVPDAASPPLVNGLLRVLSDPLAAVEYVLTLMANGLVHVHVLHPRNMAQGGVLFIGGIVTAGYVAATWFYFRNRMYRDTLLPLALILYTGAFILQLVLTRFGRPIGFPLRMGFAGEPQFGLVGVTWIFAKAALDGPALSGTRLNIKAICVIAALSMAMIVPEYFNARAALAMTQNNSIQHARLVNRLRRGAVEVPRGICRAGPQCAESLEILVENRLSAFEPKKREVKQRSQRRQP